MPVLCKSHFDIVEEVQAGNHAEWKIWTWKESKSLAGLLVLQEYPRKFPGPSLPDKGKFLGVDQGPEDIFVSEFGCLFVFLDVFEGGGKFLCIGFMTQCPKE